jgi:hypothetical protein
MKGSVTSGEWRVTRKWEEGTIQINHNRNTVETVSEQITSISPMVRVRHHAAGREATHRTGNQPEVRGDPLRPIGSPVQWLDSSTWNRLR